MLGRYLLVKYVCCANDAMSGRVDESMMRDKGGETYGFLCFTEEVTLPSREHVASLSLRWAAEDQE